MSCVQVQRVAALLSTAVLACLAVLALVDHDTFNPDPSAKGDVWEQVLARNLFPRGRQSLLFVLVLAASAAASELAPALGALGTVVALPPISKTVSPSPPSAAAMASRSNPSEEKFGCALLIVGVKLDGALPKSMIIVI